MVKTSGFNLQQISRHSRKEKQWEFSIWKEEEILHWIHFKAFVYLYSSTFADGFKKMTKLSDQPNMFYAQPQTSAIALEATHVIDMLQRAIFA